MPCACCARCRPSSALPLSTAPDGSACTCRGLASTGPRAAPTAPPSPPSSERARPGSGIGEVSYYRGSEPYLTVAISGNRPSVGVVVAEVNLKLIWDVISAIKVGETGYAFVLDGPGRLVAHPDISLVLRGADEATLAPFQAIRAAVVHAGAGVATGRDAQGNAIAAAAAPVAGPDWTVVVEQPLSEAFGPIYAALWRTGGLLLAGAAFAGLLAFALARRMTEPIRLLEEGTERIGAGQFDHRIEIRTGDELQRLADSFNAMAAELAVSQERQERIAKLKRFLAPQVAELVDRKGDDGVLEGRRTEVVAVFCDLRGFTAFSARAAPEEVMSVLSEYYEALGRIITQYAATLTSFSGDGLMVLVNAPVPVEEPALPAVDLAVEMQTERAGAHRRLASARPPDRVRSGPCHGAGHGRADRLREPLRLHGHRQRREPRRPALRVGSGSGDPDGSGRRRGGEGQARR